MPIPDDRKYSKEHEWVLVEKETLVLIGITDYAQAQLGDVVFLELPPAGTYLQQFQKMGEIESVKAVSDVYSPVSGEVTMVNTQAQEKPELVNGDPYGDGWLVKMNMSDFSEMNNLLSMQQYEEFLSQQE